MELFLALVTIAIFVIIYVINRDSNIVGFLVEQNFNKQRQISRLEDDLNSLVLSSSNQLIPLRNDLKREIKLIADEVMLLKQKKESKKINKKRKHGKTKGK